MRLACEVLCSDGVPAPPPPPPPSPGPVPPRSLRDGHFNYPGPVLPLLESPGAFAGGSCFGAPTPTSTDLKYLLELRAEANYYGLTGLMAAIDRFPHGLTKVARTAALNMEDSWMWVARAWGEGRGVVGGRGK